MTLREELAWFSGIFDGEGTLGAYSYVSKKTGITHRQIQFAICANDPSMIIRCREVILHATGHTPSVLTYQHDGDRKYHLWRLILSNQKILRTLLPLMVPFLTTKRKQAEAMVLVLEKKSRWRHWPTGMFERLSDELKRLKTCDLLPVETEREALEAFKVRLQSELAGNGKNAPEMRASLS